MRQSTPPQRRSASHQPGVAYGNRDAAPPARIPVSRQLYPLAPPIQAKEDPHAKGRPHAEDRSPASASAPAQTGAPPKSAPPPIAAWDTERSFHRKTDEALKLYDKKWQEGSPDNVLAQHHREAEKKRAERAAQEKETLRIKQEMEKSEDELRSNQREIQKALAERDLPNPDKNVSVAIRKSEAVRNLKKYEKRKKEIDACIRRLSKDLESIESEQQAGASGGEEPSVDMIHAAMQLKLQAAVSELQERGIFFSHEMALAHVPFAIAQGGLQSGYAATKALGLEHAQHDEGKVQHAFVFTRQLPSRPIKKAVSEGQVGSKAGAMIVLSPTAFGDPDQQAFFKSYDGAHNDPIILPDQSRKAEHVQRQAEQFSANHDPVFHANQEQGLRGSIALRHIAMIVLKSSPAASKEQLQILEQEFIDSIKNQHARDQLPPRAVRARIQAIKDPEKQAVEYEAWKQNPAEGGKSLYDLLEEGLNHGLPGSEHRRRPEDIVKAVKEDTDRGEVSDLAARLQRHHSQREGARPASKRAEPAQPADDSDAELEELMRARKQAAAPEDATGAPKPRFNIDDDDL